MLWFWLIAGCQSAAPCAAGEVLGAESGVCEPYVPGEPVVAEAWRPGVGASWQWQLTDGLDASLDVEMYDVDPESLSDAEWRSLEGRVRICYFSAGSLEDFREDVGWVSPEAVGKTLRGWPDERWLDVRHPDAFLLVQQRLDAAVARGCDGVEPDNVDGYANASGFALSATDQLRFNRFVADEAHLRGLSVGLKNDVDQLEALQPWFDWALNESCLQYDECGRYAGWLDAGLAVFHTEYVERVGQLEAARAEVCAARPAGFSTLVKTWDLGAEFVPCE